VTGDWVGFYDARGGLQRVPRAVALMARHLHAEHGKSVRQINRALGLTDRVVRALIDPEETP
jgi:hypothetical protein